MKSVACINCSNFIASFHSPQGLGGCEDWSAFLARHPAKDEQDRRYQLLGGYPFYPMADRYCDYFEHKKARPSGEMEPGFAITTE